MLRMPFGIREGGEMGFLKDLFAVCVVRPELVSEVEEQIFDHVVGIFRVLGPEDD
jgi:hypothetical protein